jgi:hypothetical protein
VTIPSLSRHALLGVFEKAEWGQAENHNQATGEEQLSK